MWLRYRNKVRSRVISGDPRPIPAGKSPIFVSTIGAWSFIIPVINYSSSGEGRARVRVSIFAVRPGGCRPRCAGGGRARPLLVDHDSRPPYARHGRRPGNRASQGGRTADGHRAPRQRGPQLREPGEGGSARSRPAPAGSGWTPSSIPMPAQSEVDAWVQGAPAVQQPIVVPDRKMSRKARREAERAFAARAAAELEARQARRAQEAAAAQRSFGAAPARAAAPARPAAAARPAAGVPAQAQGFAPVQPAYGAPSGARARHAR